MTKNAERDGKMSEIDELKPYDGPGYMPLAMELVQTWRANADVLEAYPALVRYADDPERFERELWEAQCALEAIDAGELDAELDAEFGDDQDDE